MNATASDTTQPQPPETGQHIMHPMHDNASMTRVDNGGNPDISNMDDLQFDASLDALLNSENLGDTTVLQPATTTTGDSSNSAEPTMIQYHSNAASMTADLMVNAPPPPAASTPQPASTSCPPQGLLTGDSTSHGYMMHLPYAMTDTQSSISGQPISNGPMSVTAGPAAYAPSYHVQSLVQMPPALAASPGPLALAQQPQHGQQKLAPQPHQGQQQQPQTLMPGPPPPSICDMSAPMSATSSVTSASTSRKRNRAITEVSEDEEDKDRRRYDRNLREQQRSHKITQRIAELRDVLAAANIKFKPDKYSTLVKVSDYIKQLQSRSSMLDQEHKKLLDTIAKTNEVVNNQYLPSKGENAPAAVKSSPDGATSGDEHDSLVFVRGIDYKSVFARCGVALAVASIDGRLMDCNREFEKLTAYNRVEMLPCESTEEGNESNGDRKPPPALVADTPTSSGVPLAPPPVAAATEAGGPQPVPQRNLSLFNLLCREDMEDLFLAMSEMLKHPTPSKEKSEEASSEPALSTSPEAAKDFWTGIIRLSRMRDVNMRMSVALVRSPMGRARFFDCSIHPVSEMAET